MFLMLPGQQYVGRLPPGQKSGSFVLDHVLESLQRASKDCAAFEVKYVALDSLAFARRGKLQHFDKGWDEAVGRG